MSYPPGPSNPYDKQPGSNNPYGQQPQPPQQPGYGNPYGQQQPQPPQQPGYGYPGQQPPAQPGYGIPQQQPYPAGYGYPQQGAGYGYPPNPYAQPVLAHWGLRLGSFIIDYLITFAPNGVLTLAGGAGLRLIGLVLMIAGGLFICHQEGTTGQTPGRKAVGTRLLREQDGQVIGFGSAVGRRLLHIVDAIPCYVGFLWPLWDGKKQTFADKIMKTVVIKAR